MRSVRSALGAMTAAVLLWPANHAMAEVQDPASATPMPSNPALAVSGMLAGLGAPVASDRLEAIRGGAEVVVNDMRLAGVVADNTANRVITGSNAIADGAFANASGIPTVIQNTGANTLIQNATILNVRFGP